MPRMGRGPGPGARGRRTVRRRRRVRRRRVMLVGGLVGFGVYKMSTKDAQRVEQKSGIPPEEMTDEELAQTMDELGIQKQTIDATDKEASSGQADASAEQPSIVDQLKSLAELHEQGVLTDDEFAAQKKRLLDG